MENQPTQEKRNDICRRCGKKLKNSKSIEMGFGATCYKKFMVETKYKPLFEVKRNESRAAQEGIKAKT